MNKVQHFEIPADDTARARKFYEETFGWTTAEWPMPGGGVYIGLMTGPTDPTTHMAGESGFINGGMVSKTDNFTKQVVITMTTEDIAATLDKVKANGGIVTTEPITIPDMGIYAYFKDTEGNLTGLWQALKK